MIYWILTSRNFQTKQRLYWTTEKRQCLCHQTNPCGISQLVTSLPSEKISPSFNGYVANNDLSAQCLNLSILMEVELHVHDLRRICTGPGKHFPLSVCSWWRNTSFTAVRTLAPANVTKTMCTIAVYYVIWQSRRTAKRYRPWTDWSHQQYLIMNVSEFLSNLGPSLLT